LITNSQHRLDLGRRLRPDARLAVFVLGVMYSHRYIPTDGEGLTAIMIAAYLLADQSDYDPVRSDGPGLW